MKQGYFEEFCGLTASDGEAALYIRGRMNALDDLVAALTRMAADHRNINWGVRDNAEETADG
ncbi:MAG: hypothetical protein ACC642_00035 [Pseudomonadales bacterium]